MAYEESLRSVTLLADSSIGIYTGPPGMPGSASPNSGKQYRFVKVTGADTVGLATGATDIICGILQSKPQTVGEESTVGFSGIAKLVAGAAVTAGQLVAPDSTGRGVHDDTNGRWQALKGAAAAGEVIPVFKVR